MVDQEDVRRIALALPGATESADHFGFYVRGKQFAWTWHERVVAGKPRVPRPEVLVVRVFGQAEKETLLDADPGKFFTEPHYNDFPAVLVRLGAIDQDELRELVTDAWRSRGGIG
jgi:hypothetical protein